MKDFKHLEPIISDLADHLIDNPKVKACFSDDTFIDTGYIFITALLDKMYDYNVSRNMHFKDMMENAGNAGEELRQLIIKYTNIDPHEYSKKLSGKQN